jgi:hypothetical protein
VNILNLLTFSKDKILPNNLSLMIVRSEKLVDEYSIIPDKFSVYFETVGSKSTMVYQEKCELTDGSIDSWLSPDTKLEYNYDKNTKTLSIKIDGKKEDLIGRLLQEILTIAKSTIEEKTLAYIWQRTKVLSRTV